MSLKVTSHCWMLQPSTDRLNRELVGCHLSCLSIYPAISMHHVSGYVYHAALRHLTCCVAPCCTASSRGFRGVRLTIRRSDPSATPHHPRTGVMSIDTYTVHSTHYTTTHYSIRTFSYPPLVHFSVDMRSTLIENTPQNVSILFTPGVYIF